MSNRGALMQDDAVGGFELSYDGARTVACCLDDADALFDDDACVTSVIRWDESWEEGEVDAKGILSHGSTAADLLAEVFRCGLGQRRQLQKSLGFDVLPHVDRYSYNSKTAGIADGARKLSISDPLHATLNHRYYVLLV